LAPEEKPIKKAKNKITGSWKNFRLSAFDGNLTATGLS